MIVASWTDGKEPLIDQIVQTVNHVLQKVSDAFPIAQAAAHATAQRPAGGWLRLRPGSRRSA
jgi:hypothetical protein